MVPNTIKRQSHKLGKKQMKVVNNSKQDGSEHDKTAVS